MRAIIRLVLALGFLMSVATAASADRWGIHSQLYAEPHEPDNPLYGNVGLSAGVPLFPFGATDDFYGFCAGPIVTTSYNFHTGEVVVSAAADVGYSFFIGYPFSLTLGGEIGVSAFFFGGTTAFRPHYGPAVYLYFERHPGSL